MSDDLIDDVLRTSSAAPGEDVIDRELRTPTAASAVPVAASGAAFRTPNVPGTVSFDPTRMPTDTKGDPGQDTVLGVAADRLLGGTVRGVAGGYKGIYKGIAGLVGGKDIEGAVESGVKGVESITSQESQPTSASGQTAAHVLASPYNPLNWIDASGQKLGDLAAEHGAWPIASTALRVAPDVAASFLGFRRGVAGPATGAEPEAFAGSAHPVELTAADIPRTASPEALKSFQNEAPAAPAAEAPTVPTSQGASSSSVQARAQVLHDVGLNEARNSALHNDGPAAMGEFQTSRDPTTRQGLEARAIFDRERETLSNFSSNIAQKTGGSIGTDGATLEARGGTILKPFDDLQNWFDQQRKALYSSADARAQGIPTDLKGFQDVLKDDSLMTNQDRVGLRTGLNAYLNKLNVVDKNGNITASVQQAETIRKYLNDEWSPQNSKLAGKLKSALDDDVTQAAGTDIYKNSRALVTQQKNTLENPNGLGSLLDASGPEGINRKVPLEKVPDRLLSMPQAQLEHVVTTLRGMPEELQPQAQSALSEMQAHYASRLSDIGNKFDGPWNHRGVNQFLDNTSGKAPLIFGENNPLLRDMDTLRAAGNILRVDRSYPGAAVQGRILRSKLLPGAIATAGGLLGGGIGSVLGMPTLGTTVGAGAGGALAHKVSEGAARSALRGRMSQLSDVLPP